MQHSIMLEYKKCRGCTTCIKNCPTEAIRVRNGKATILPNRCIDCGTCIRVCPHRAVRSVPDSFNALQNYQYAVAIPDPTLYGQFHNLDDVNLILNGLLELGFDDVYEAASASQLLAATLKKQAERGDRLYPQISALCPAVVRLIRLRFPSLMGHVAPLLLPTELAAILARQKAVEETGLLPEEIGVFSIVPCSSLVTSASSPDGLDKPVLDGAFSVRDIYLALLEPMRKLDRTALQPLATPSAAGIRWAYPGGEASCIGGQDYVAVDGIDNVIRMLEDIEDDRVPDARYVELRACTQGCLGGCLTAENPFAARMRLESLIQSSPKPDAEPPILPLVEETLERSLRPEFLPTYVLDPDRRRAMEKMQRIQTLEEQLPGLRCGSCGAPSCRAFAEDVVMGRAREEDCIFKVRERMQHMTGNTDADEYLPAPFRRRKPNKTSAAQADDTLIVKGATSVTVQQLAQRLELHTFHLGDPERAVDNGYCGDLLSWVMGGAPAGCAWMTIMSNVNVAAVASLADVACVILTEGVQPDAPLLKRAQTQDITLLGTSLSAYQCAARLADALK